MQFTQGKEIDLWSGSFSLQSIEDTKLVDTIRQTVHTDGQNFLGFKSAGENLLTRTRYPRQKYGIPDVESCRQTTKKLVQSLGIPDFIEMRPHKDAVCRIVMGLQEGYNANAFIHGVDEVRQILSSYTTDIEEGEIFSLLRGKDPYTEPAVIIGISRIKVGAVYQLADRFRQERFCMEDLHRMKACIVETSHCREPDEVS